ncbi:MAG: hypothetical protein Q9201_000338 [Fulgogasparrea decipioides]
MPQNPAPRRASKRQEKVISPSELKALDIGKPLGVCDTNSVRDRVRQWQAQGGGVVTAPDVYIEDGARLGRSEDNHDNKSATKKTVRTSPAVRQVGNGDQASETPRDRDDRQKNKSVGKDKERKRSKSAPSKRVVSDAHWRKDRSPPKDTNTPKVAKGTPASKKVNDDDDGIRVRPMSTPKEETPSSKREGRRESSKHEKGPKEDRATLESHQRHEIHSTPTNDARSMSADEEDLQDLGYTSSSPTADPTQRRKRSENGGSPSLDSSSRSHRVGTHANVTPSGAYPEQRCRSTYGNVSERRSSRKSQKSNILSQVFEESRKAFPEPQAIPIETPRVPSIEAWLNDTFDPFVDGEKALADQSIQQSGRAERPKPTPEAVPVDDPNKIWDTLNSKNRARSGVHASRRRKRIPSSTIYKGNPFPADFESGSPLQTPAAKSTSASKLIDLVDRTAESPSSLTRRSARKSLASRKREPKPIPVEDRLQGIDGASVISINPTVSSIEPSNSANPLRPPGLSRRPFPSTGRHRLSTIASVDTLNSKLPASGVPTIPEALDAPRQADSTDAEVLEATSGDQFDPNSLTRNKSRLAKHADLMSVLSMPEPGNKSIRSARSIRTNRSRLATATIGDLMTELSSDEQKYMRELRTLVDGVIPVLLTCVLSKSDSAVAKGLFRPSYSNEEDPYFTKPVVDMGIALERLKTLHRRIPTQDKKSLLNWAQGAQRVYAEYLKAWRMGFQDVVVNLAPAAGNQRVNENAPVSREGGLDEGLPINKDGDVVNGDGERVDVAFLLKRPLVRLKYLAKTLKGINVVSPSAEAELLAIKYQNLVTMARNRSNEERARLEDEAAANIDPSRARDPRTLAPLTGVSIDRTRRVRARDHFNLALQHSSGQRIDCRVELLLRDEASELAGSGDLLICEVDGTGRWLLFPPVQFGRVSARNGDLQGEIIVMVRGLTGAGIEWHEILSLRSEDDQSAFEWVQMLGLTPVPPAISRTQSFLSRHQRKKSTPSQGTTLDAPSTPISSPAKSRTPSPREVEVPIGEQPAHSTRVWNESSNCASDQSFSADLDAVRSKQKLQKSQDLTATDMTRSPSTYVDEVNDLRSLPSQTSERNKREQEPMHRPRSFKEALGLTGTSTNSLGLKRTKAQKLSGPDGSPRGPKSPRPSKYDEGSPRSPTKTSTNPQEPTGRQGHSQRGYSPGSLRIGLMEDSSTSYKDRGAEEKKDARPHYHRSPSSIPSMDLPTIPKIRKDSPPATPIDEPEEEPQWSTPPESRLPSPPTKDTEKHSRKRLTKPAPSASSILGTRSLTPSSSAELGGSKVPVLNASTSHIARRRSSSPLKHEYEPSTASDSSDSEASTVDRNEVSSVSSSDDDELEEGDAPTPLLPLGVLGRVPKALPQGSIYSLPNGTLKPSESASQAPYKKVPSQPTKASKTIASIFSWTEKGSWESLHPDECSIVITPGLIEAYEMSAAHSTGAPLSSPTPVVDVDAFSELASNVTGPEEVPNNERPLVALELTPLVPLRRGTAIDISIRSPPTAKSQITSGNNIMFRSRNPEECEALYALINHSRIHNPTYITLQNARGPFGAGNDLDRRASTRAGGSRMSSWFGGLGGSSGYRASSAPTPSIAPSESSIGSMSSAFSALKRFGRGGGGMFNIARSTISSREGSRANSLYTSSDNSSGSGASTPLPPGMQTDPHGTLGLGNTKIRLYFRESQTRWRDMGSARLTIMRPPPPDLPPGTSASGESVARPSMSGRQGANEKRIVVRGKTKGEILLDATLGETCFERVGRQGIAVSVWEDIVGPNGEVGTVGAVGGVGAGRAKVYMIQVKPRRRTRSQLLED